MVICLYLLPFILFKIKSSLRKLFTFSPVQRMKKKIIIRWENKTFSFGSGISFWRFYKRPEKKIFLFVCILVASYIFQCWKNLIVWNEKKYGLKIHKIWTLKLPHFAVYCIRNCRKFMSQILFYVGNLDDGIWVLRNKSKAILIFLLKIFQEWI